MVCVPSLLFDLQPNYGGGNEDNGNLLPKAPCRHCCIQCPKRCSRPLLTHASTRGSWTLVGKSGSVSFQLTAPFSWVLVHTSFWTNTPKIFPFCYRALQCKTRKSRNTWSNRQIWPWSTTWSRAKANRVLPREHTGHSKHPLPRTQERTLHMGITRWSIPKSDWLYSLHPKMEKLYTVSKNKTRSWLWLRSWTLYCQIQT